MAEIKYMFTSMLVHILLKLADLWRWLYTKSYEWIYALLGRKEEKRHVCTKFKDCGVVTVNGQLVHSQKCVECGRIVTIHGTYTSPEQVEKLRLLAEMLSSYELPTDPNELVDRLENLAQLAAEALESN